MDIKKMLLISIIAVAIMVSVSAVSAGWFDFGGDDDKAKNVTVDIIESSLTYNCISGNGLSIDSNGDNFKVEQDNSGNDGKTLEYEGYVKLNVSNLNQNELKENLSKDDYPNNYYDINVRCDKLSTVSLFVGDNYTLDNGILTIEFNGTEKLNSYDKVQPGSSGTENVTGGSIYFTHKESSDFFIEFK